MLSDSLQVPERSINSSTRRPKYLLHVFRLTLSNAKEPVQQDWFPYHKQCRTYHQSYNGEIHAKTRIE